MTSNTPTHLFKVHQDDPKATTARMLIRDTRCIHCGDKYVNGSVISYTQLSTGKVIWWHKSHIIDDYND